MTIDNFIETQYRKLSKELSDEFFPLYSGFNNSKLQTIFSTLHLKIIKDFDSMNSRLPTNFDSGGYFWADSSRSLINSFEIIEELQKNLANTELSFKVDEYYHKLIMECKKFLNMYHGSTIPPGMEKIDLYYTIPIFLSQNVIIRNDIQTNNVFELKHIGEGSYANVYQYFDEFYQKKIVLKRAKKNLTEKEITRFRQEYNQMKILKSPYIVDVYGFNQEKLEYTMECMDITLEKYITNMNSKLSDNKRKNICNQVIKAFTYIHSKDILHRDISPNNVLLEYYEDVLVVKISDFGLVKLPESTLTSHHTDLKGIFNDPNLRVEGFDNYDVTHETYALTRLIFYILTGKTQTNNIKNQKIQQFVEKGLHSNKEIRFQNIDEFYQGYKSIWE